MAGDYSRIANGLYKHYAEVLMQQGRAHLDADWNSMAHFAARRWDTQAADTFGPAAVPTLTTPNGFKITATSSGTDLAIGVGRCYVDGIQAELFNGETVNGQPVTYLNQPFYPNPPAISGSGLVYLDVWKREVTYIEDPDLLDVALGGVDTTTRIQTVWQVKLLSSASAGNTQLSCSTDLSGLLPPSAGQISTQAVAPVAPTDPCILPDQGGYRGIENRLYRVEIHTAGDISSARWKWSRENASIVSRITGITNAATSCKLTVDRIGRDAVLRFKANDWVEIIDDATELAGLPGTMAQIVGPPDETTRSITLDRPLPASFNAADPARHTRLIRWDQSQGVDSNGLLPITAGWMDLEDGVQVALTLDGTVTNGQFHTADHWCFAARTIDASVQTLTKAPPLAIHHHFAVLASYTTSGSTVTVGSDCRVPWPPNVPTETGCGCTVCVDATDHNAGTATIEMAIEKVRSTGGRICLGPGVFHLGATLMMENLSAVTLYGQGPSTVLLFAGDGPAVQIATGLGLSIEELTVLAVAIAPGATLASGAPAPASIPVAIGILLRNSAEIAIERCGILAVSSTSNKTAAAAPAPAPASGLENAVIAYQAPLASSFNPGGMAIALDGFLLEVLIRDNVLVADLGVGKLGLLLNNTAAGATVAKGTTLAAVRDILMAGDLEIIDNWMPCALAGIGIADLNSDTALSAFLLEISLSANRFLGCRTAGIGIEGVALPDAVVRIERNHVDVQGIGIVCGTDGLVVSDNFITQAMSGANASTLGKTNVQLLPAAIQIGSVPGGKLPVTEAHVSRNHITLFGGPGIQVTGAVLVSSIIENSITEVTGHGILASGTGTPSEIIIRNNEVLAVLEPPAPPSNLASNNLTGTFAREYLKADISRQASATAAIVGIEVVGIPTTVIQNNTVGLVGNAANQPIAAAGILLQKVQAATVSGNDISDIGVPGSLDQPSYGIAVASAFTQLVASDNLVRQNSTDTSQTGRFTALFINDANGTGEMFTAEGNMMSGNSAVPLVNIGHSGHCLFTGNACNQFNTQQTGEPAAQLTCDTAIAGNNRIVCANTQTGLAITVSTSDPKAPPPATVLGNIVSHAITLNGAALGTPWAPLNILT
ncbi:DUF6519 domain-containing protein [Dyella silvae]|uniref:DUF6519 domain-containing protein n=1 Tax=Dyella silvae TaxID=2994424 RepID=UPI002263D848|nr:DUF6519 domain-containing protein [Dyella silvae]